MAINNSKDKKFINKKSVSRNNSNKDIRLVRTKKEKIINENSEIKITSISSSEQYKKALDEKNKNTINEPIRDTIKRDLYLIWTKLKYVINPFVKEKDRNKHIKQWDLWGPLIFTILLSFTLAIKSNEKSDMFILIFMIFWFGSFLIYLNINLLGLNIGFFQIYCLLGYCLFPLNISAFIFDIDLDSFHYNRITYI